MSFNPRQWLIALATVVIVAAAGIYVYVSRPSPAVMDATGEAETLPSTAAPSDELMVPGPLGDQALGDPKAPDIVIEYASMTCPHCQRFHTDVFPEFKRKYIDTGKVYFIFREFPLDPLATSASMVARCAPKERFFAMIDLLFEHQSSWAFVQDPVTALRDLVKQAGFTEESFNACLRNQEILDGVNWVHNRASERFDVTSTPTFFFNGEKRSGEQQMVEIDQLLGG